MGDRPSPIFAGFRYFCKSIGTEHRGVLYLKLRYSGSCNPLTGFAIQKPPGCEIKIHKPKAVWPEKYYENNRREPQKSDKPTIEWFNKHFGPQKIPPKGMWSEMYCKNGRLKKLEIPWVLRDYSFSEYFSTRPNFVSRQRNDTATDACSFPPDCIDPLTSRQIVRKQISGDDDFFKDHLIFISVSNIHEVRDPLICNFWQTPPLNHGDCGLVRTHFSIDAESMKKSTENISGELIDLIINEEISILEWPIDKIRKHLMIKE